MAAHSAAIAKTARLTLRLLTAADRDALVALNADTQVMRHVGPPLSEDDSAAMLASALAGYADRSLGWYAAETRDARAWIGLAALKPISALNRTALGKLVDDDKCIEVGWRLRPEFWGRGYATETGAALLARGFEALQLPRLVGLALAANAASCRALENIGLGQVADYVVLNQPARMYAIDREQYAARRSHNG